MKVAVLHEDVEVVDRNDSSGDERFLLLGVVTDVHFDGRVPSPRCLHLSPRHAKPLLLPTPSSYLLSARLTSGWRRIEMLSDLVQEGGHCEAKSEMRMGCSKKWQRRMATRLDHLAPSQPQRLDEMIALQPVLGQWVATGTSLAPQLPSPSHPVLDP